MRFRVVMPEFSAMAANWTAHPDAVAAMNYWIQSHNPFVSPPLYADPAWAFPLFFHYTQRDDYGSLTYFDYGGATWNITFWITFGCIGGISFYCSIHRTSPATPPASALITGSLNWAVTDCCRSTGNATFTDSSGEYGPWELASAATSSIEVIGNTCCKNVDGSCTQTGAASCGAAQNGNCNPLP